MIQLVNQENGESDFDSPWADDRDDVTSSNVEVPWERLSHDFANAGYREGIAFSKDAALQEGFDTGYASSAPIGREIGVLRGHASVLVAFLSLLKSDDILDAKAISSDLASLGPKTHDSMTLQSIQLRLRDLCTKHDIQALW